MQVVNKWNNNTYEVVKQEGNMVSLKRADGSVFTISYTEFKFSYRGK